MLRSGPALILLMGLLPATAVLAADAVPAAATVTPPAAATMTAPSKAMAVPAPASTSMPAAATSVTHAAMAMPTASAPMTGNQLPSRGMNMANVEHIYGAPLEKLAPVPAKGTREHPPITRWIYPGFVVYFEYDHVVHAVIKAHPFKDAHQGG